MTDTTLEPHRPPESNLEGETAGTPPNPTIFTPRDRIGRMRFLVYSAPINAAAQLLPLILFPPLALLFLVLYGLSST